MFLPDILFQADSHLFSLNIKQDFAVGVILVIDIHSSHPN